MSRGQRGRHAAAAAAAELGGRAGGHISLAWLSRCIMRLLPRCERAGAGSDQAARRQQAVRLLRRKRLVMSRACVVSCCAGRREAQQAERRSSSASPRKPIRCSPPPAGLDQPSTATAPHSHGRPRPLCSTRALLRRRARCTALPAQTATQHHLSPAAGRMKASRLNTLTAARVCCGTGCAARCCCCWQLQPSPCSPRWRSAAGRRRSRRPASLQPRSR